MSKHTLLFGAALACTLLAGCFTISETERPMVSFTQSSGNATNITVAVRGFATTLTDYVTVCSQQTVFYQGGYGRYGCGSGFGNAYTTTTIPRLCPCDTFYEQARINLENLGFNIMAQTPDYVIDARFAGPESSCADTAASIAWILCSLFTCDHAAQTWHATMRIHDNHTGRLLLTRDYSQRYEVTGFSPIPLFGISGYNRTTTSYMQCWCLGVLTDQMTADAAQFLTSGK